jgi:hypothetical protein
MQGATAFLIRRWRVNSAFDPDPLFGGGTLAGFPQMAAIYQQYRVENFKVRFEVVANEPSTAVSFGLIFRDSDPATAILSYTDAQNAIESEPTTGPHSLGQTTGTSVYRHGWETIKPSTICGNALMYYSDQDFSGLVTGNPNSMVYMGFILMANSSAGALTNGAQVTMFMEFTVRFFGHKTVLETNGLRDTADAIDLYNKRKALEYDHDLHSKPHMFRHPAYDPPQITVDNAMDIEERRWNDIVTKLKAGNGPFFIPKS